MFLGFLEEIEVNLAHAKQQVLTNSSIRNNIEVHSLIRKNEDLFKGLNLEFAHDPSLKTDSVAKQIARCKKEHQHICRLMDYERDTITSDNVDTKIQKKIENIKFHKDKMNILNNVENNVVQSNQMSNTISGQLDHDLKSIFKQSERVKILGTDLVLTNEMIKKIKRRELRSNLIYKTSMYFPLTCFVLLMLIKIIKLFF